MSLEYSEITRRNIGRSKNNRLPKLIKKIIITPNSFELAAGDYLDGPALKTALQAAIKAAYNSRAYLFPDFVKCEDISEGYVYEDTALSVIDVRPGQYRYKGHVSKNMFMHQALFTHKYINDGRVILIDLEGKALFTRKSNGKLAGMSIALFNPEQMDVSDGSNSTTSPVYLVLADNKEWDESGVLLDGSVIRELDPLTDVAVTLADGDAFAAAGFMVDVKQESDGTPVSGLVVADFLMKLADGITPQVIDTAAEDANVPGRYNLVPDTVFADGSLTLRAASALTVSAYENPERLSLAINVP